jgi:tripartite-type tricarboxylate transporter receptor subunit TctC
VNAAATRRALLGALAAGAFAGSHAAGRPLRMVVPQAPGGAADVIARLIGERLQRTLARPVVVDNRPGGGTVAGTLAVALAPPDGNTFGMVFSPYAINQALRQQMPYNVLTDFEPVCLGGYSIVVLVAGADFAAAGIGPLIELARRADPPLQYASLGVGSVSHLAGELFNIEADTALEHVPYNGSAGIYQALVSGQVPLAFVTLESALPHWRAGRLKVLGLTNAQRSLRYPKIPAIAETLPGFELVGFFGFVAPARTPADVVRRLGDEIAAALREPAIGARLADDGAVIAVAPGAAFAIFLRAQIDKYTALARRTGLKVD